MNRKHFRVIANILKANLSCSTSGDEAERVAQIGRELAGVCAAENPRFDCVRFYAACGLDSTGRLCGHFAHVHSFCNVPADAAV